MTLRLFQNVGLYPAYARHLERLSGGAVSHAERIGIFLGDRFGAPHILKPVLDGSADAFCTVGDNEAIQRAWARQNGLPDNASLTDILLAQIEAHRTDVFYNLDPINYDSAFVRRLPGCVRRVIAWRGAPTGSADLSAYQLVLCNFPSMRRLWQARGWQSATLFPAHDPVMDAYAANRDRPIDVLFIGTYSRHHLRRAETLQKIADLNSGSVVRYHLLSSRLVRLASTPLGWAGPLRKLRQPATIRAVAAPPLFGVQMYEALSKARVVFNGSIDMAEEDRGNMRCWEAMGCGAALVSDDGAYPDGMREGETLRTYGGPDDAVDVVRHLLASEDERAALADRGHSMISTRYSKERQWSDFNALL